MEDDYYGTYDDDFGFNMRNFYSNERELIDKGLIIPLYTHPQPPIEADKVRELEGKLIEALDALRWIAEDANTGESGDAYEMKSHANATLKYIEAMKGEKNGR